MMGIFYITESIGDIVDTITDTSGIYDIFSWFNQPKEKS